MSAIAIVAEGGGQRGIYTAGVLDAFLEKDFNPFDLGVGVSAGAQNLLAYFLEQSGYAKRAIVELTNRPDFLVPYRWLASRSIIDLDSYFETSLKDPEYMLPYQNIATVAHQRRLQFVATDGETLDAVYLEPDETTVLDYVKASSAVPFLYRAGVTINDRMLVDGGVADPVPVQHAYKQGARNIVLVRTAPVLAFDEFERPWRRRLEHARRLPVKPALVVRMLERHEQAIQEALHFMRHPPEDLRLHVIAPPIALKSQMFASRSEDLIHDYQQGRDHGQRAVGELEIWLHELTDDVAV